MLKKLISLTLSLLFVYTIQAQAIQWNYQWNEKKRKEGIAYQIIHKEADKVYILETKMKGALRTRNEPVIVEANIQEYSTTGRLLKTSPITDVDFKENPICSMNGRYINGQYHTFLEYYTHYKKRDVYFGVFDLSTGKLVEKLEKKDNYEALKVTGKRNRYNYSDRKVYQEIVTSQDGSKTLFLSSNCTQGTTNDDKENGKLYLRCVDNNTGKMLWEKNELIDFSTGEELRPYNITISNDGNQAHLLMIDVIIIEEVSPLKSAVTKKEIVVWTYSNQGTTLKKSKIAPAEDYYIGGSELLVTASNTLYCIGTYQKGKEETSERGLFYATIDSDNEKSSAIQYQPFSGAIKTSTDDNYVCSSWNDYFEPKKFNVVELYKVIEFKDGTIGILTEQLNNRGQYAQQGGDSGRTMAVVRRCRKNIFFTTIKNGKFDANVVIPKAENSEKEECVADKWDIKLALIDDKAYLLVPSVEQKTSIIELSSAGTARKSKGLDLGIKFNILTKHDTVYKTNEIDVVKSIGKVKKVINNRHHQLGYMTINPDDIEWENE